MPFFAGVFARLGRRQPSKMAMNGFKLWRFSLSTSMPMTNKKFFKENQKLRMTVTVLTGHNAGLPQPALDQQQQRAPLLQQQWHHMLFPAFQKKRNGYSKKSSVKTTTYKPTSPTRNGTHEQSRTVDNNKEGTQQARKTPVPSSHPLLVQLLQITCAFPNHHLSLAFPQSISLMKICHGWFQVKSCISI